MTPESPSLNDTAWGAAIDAAENTPIEPVWALVLFFFSNNINAVSLLVSKQGNAGQVSRQRGRPR